MTMTPEVLEPTDKELAVQIRANIEILHRSIRKATEAGLQVTANLQGIGGLTFAYKDGCKITRNL